MIRSCVIIENGSAEKRVFPIYTRVTIGRASVNDISLSEPTVSKRHAALGRVRGVTVIKDLGSQNGTFVNGRRVEKAVLSSGDSLRVGRASLRFVQDQRTTDVSVDRDAIEFQFQKSLGEYLVRADIIQEFTLKVALDNQHKSQTIGQILISMGVADDEGIAAALAKQLNLPLVRLDGLEIPEQTLSLVPAAIAKTNWLIPIKIADKLHIAMANPLDTEAIQVVRMTSAKNVEIAVTPQQDLLRAWGRCYTEQYPNQALEVGPSLDDLTPESQ